MLLLAEQLFLLSIDPKTNRPYARASTTLPFSLSGALLAELMLDEKVVEKGSKLEVIDDKIEDPLLKETLEMMRLKDNKTAKYWVPKLKSNHKNLPRKVAEKLDNEGVGTVQDKRMLGIFPSYIYIFEHETFFKNRKEAFKLVLDKYKEQQPLEKEEEKIVVLMSLAYVSNLIRIIFPNKTEAKQVEKQLKQISKNVPVSKAVKSTMDAINITIIASVNSGSQS